MADDDNNAPKPFVFYHYAPSLAAAVLFCIFFSISTLFHTWRMTAQRTWYFVPFVIGCLFEAVGYIGRALSSNEAPDFTQNPYIIQSVLLLLGPTLMAASVYMILGRLMIVLHADRHALIRPNWVTKVFVLGDMLSFCTQGGGAGLLTAAKTQQDVNTGNHIIVGGLVIQILFFFGFCAVAAVFHVRIRRWPTHRSLALTTPWRGLLYALYGSSCLLLIRFVYRAAEYAQGADGTLQGKEFWLYVFDALPMLTITGVFAVFHPSRVINRAALEDKPATPVLGLDGHVVLEDGSPQPSSTTGLYVRDTAV
ncbi:RTA-like protein [Niveomyces insectorum RCEF 264]|uniref:RTA-like protein n=1 Tax=Niveomyces insectorum RCEF 264 TaxID=1081102 RepID=A0A167NUQ7_9HYPO|nr:RTA-like protein [Niveomyces insectorum RCEF 264]